MAVKVDIEQLFKRACAARTNAYAPYSGFPVGACIVTDNGEYYSGCNVENACYSMGQCAEVGAIGDMVRVQGKPTIRAVLVVADSVEPVFPCGGCLQKISEFADDQTEIIGTNLQGEHIRCALSHCCHRLYDKTMLNDKR